ncbi:MAG TPA: hypothetical protein VLG37_04510 [Candidatus Saccharimonadales bacterium]|nr:hypothetical protein [Candidatus Saccharimonadales bacterium]
MNLKGDVIEESLTNKDVLGGLRIVSTRVEKVTEEHKTPWLKQWTLHTIEVPADEIEVLAEKLSHALEPNYWYVDFKNDFIHYVIFPNKIFKVNPKNPDEYKPAITYGVNLGIPFYQLEFSPDIVWDDEKPRSSEN